MFPDFKDVAKVMTMPTRHYHNWLLLGLHSLCLCLKSKSLILVNVLGCDALGEEPSFVTINKGLRAYLVDPMFLCGGISIMKEYCCAMLL